MAKGVNQINIAVKDNKMMSQGYIQWISVWWERVYCYRSRQHA